MNKMKLPLYLFSSQEFLDCKNPSKSLSTLGEAHCASKRKKTESVNGLLTVTGLHTESLFAPHISYKPTHSCSSSFTHSSQNNYLPRTCNASGTLPRTEDENQWRITRQVQSSHCTRCPVQSSPWLPTEKAQTPSPSLSTSALTPNTRSHLKQSLNARVKH